MGAQALEAPSKPYRMSGLRLRFVTAPRPPRLTEPPLPEPEPRRRRDIPEPEWWARAVAMKNAGMGHPEIARHFNVNRCTARYAVDPAYRAKKLASRAKYHYDREVPYFQDWTRIKLRKYARELWRKDGKSRSLTRYYRDLDCL